jgi:hypothetical protein
MQHVCVHKRRRASQLLDELVSTSMHGKGERLQHPDFSCKVTSSLPRFHHVTHLCPWTQYPCKYQSKICFHLGDREQKGISGSKVTGPSSKVTSPQFHQATHLCTLIYTSSLQIPIQNLHSLVKGHWVKVKGHSTTIPPRDTPLFPNTSSLQIPIRNQHSFRRYRAAEGISGSRSLCQGQRYKFHHTTHLCPLPAQGSSQVI